MARLLDQDVKTIGNHIDNAMKEEVDSSVVANFAITADARKTCKTDHYNLDKIIFFAVWR